MLNEIIKQLEDLVDEHYNQYVNSVGTFEDIAQYHLGMSNAYQESVSIINYWLDERINEIMNED